MVSLKVDPDGVLNNSKGLVMKTNNKTWWEL